MGRGTQDSQWAEFTTAAFAQANSVFLDCEVLLLLGCPILKAMVGNKVQTKPCRDPLKESVLCFLYNRYEYFLIKKEICFFHTGMAFNEEHGKKNIK